MVKIVNEYINKVMLLSNIADNCCTADDAEEYEFWDRAWRYIRSAPTSDVAPVKRGKWEKRKFKKCAAVEFKCSVCGRESAFGVEFYCPWCGAKMEDATDV